MMILIEFSILHSNIFQRKNFVLTAYLGGTNYITDATKWHSPASGNRILQLSISDRGSFSFPLKSLFIRNFFIFFIHSMPVAVNFP